MLADFFGNRFTDLLRIFWIIVPSAFGLYALRDIQSGKVTVVEIAGKLRVYVLETFVEHPPALQRSLKDGSLCIYQWRCLWTWPLVHSYRHE